jgi:pimeloyl-ACP methyl ester carboxylesterase
VGEGLDSDRVRIDVGEGLDSDRVRIDAGEGLDSDRVRIDAGDRLDPDRLRLIDVDAVPTRVYEAGDGEPLVLAHGGAFGSLYSLDAWSTVLDQLAARFHVVAFDKLGQGHTGNPSAPEDYTFEAVVRHAIALLDALAVGPAHLVGHSMGALLVSRIALDRPDLARTVVIVDSNTLAPDDPRYPWTAFYEELALRIPPGPPTADTVRMEPDAQSFSKEHVTPDFIARLLEIAQRPENREAAEACAEVRDSIWMPSILAARAQALKDIDASGLGAPALVIWAANDVSAPLALAAPLYERISARTEQAEMHVIARAGHYVYREQPDAFVRTLAGFCAGRNPPA